MKFQKQGENVTSVNLQVNIRTHLSYLGQHTCASWHIFIHYVIPSLAKSKQFQKTLQFHNMSIYACNTRFTRHDWQRVFRPTTRSTGTNNMFNYYVWPNQDFKCPYRVWKTIQFHAKPKYLFKHFINIQRVVTWSLFGNQFLIYVHVQVWSLIKSNSCEN